jgi:hypothetical protein
VSGIRPPRHRAGVALLAAALLGLGVLLLEHATGAVGGSDSAGYANTARDLALGRIVSPIEGPSRLGLGNRWDPVFTPLAHEAGPRPGTMVPYYPPGFPLHIDLAAALAGWRDAPRIVSPTAGVLFVALVFLLCRELGLSRPYAAAGAAILAAWVIFLFHAIQPMSDVAAGMWSTASFVAALRARRRPLWALAAGAAFGLAVLVRPTNVLLLAGLAFALPWMARSFSFFVAGGLPFAAFEAFWNEAAFGSPSRTGYGGQLASELALSHFLPRFGLYGSWLIAQLSPLVPLGGIAVAANRRVAARDRALLLFWFSPILLFYCFWRPSDSWTYGRYLLPAIPALIAGFLLTLRDLVERLSSARMRVAAAGALLAVVFLHERNAYRRHRPLDVDRSQRVYPEACRALADRAAGAPALAVSMDFSAALRFYTELLPVRWDRLAPADFAALRVRAKERGFRVFAVLLPHETAPAFERARGEWVFLGKVRQAGVWELPAAP